AIERRWGVRLSLRAVFEHPTVAQLAAVIDGAAGAGPAAAAAPTSPASPIPRLHGAGPWPLAPAQQRIVVLEQLVPPGLHNVAVSLRISGPLDPGRLERAAGAVVARHAALRARIVEHEGAPAQRGEPP